MLARTTVYVEIFTGQIFCQTSYLAEIFQYGEIDFHQCGKGHHILYSPMRVGGESGKNFLLVKFSMYMV